MAAQPFPQLGDGGPVHGLRFAQGSPGPVEVSTGPVDARQEHLNRDPLCPDGVEVLGAVQLASGLRLFRHASGAHFAWCDLHQCPTAPGSLPHALDATCQACDVAHRLVRDCAPEDLAATAEHQAGLARLLFAVLVSPTAF